jgi:hypothetical protein
MQELRRGEPGGNAARRKGHSHPCKRVSGTDAHTFIAVAHGVKVDGPVDKTQAQPRCKRVYRRHVENAANPLQITQEIRIGECEKGRNSTRRYGRRVNKKGACGKRRQKGDTETVGESRERKRVREREREKEKAVKERKSQ